VHSIPDILLADVQAEYAAADGDISQLIMGEQVHVGGLHSMLALAARAGVGDGMTGVDLCCHTGAGMRALVRFCGVKEMIGVDATEQVVERGRELCRAEGLDERISFVLGDACATGLPTGEAEFVWGEDAWCYVEDKRALIVEAARLLRPAGTIAFTDWVEGPAGLEAAEAERLLRFMRFPSILNIDDYRLLLDAAKLRIEVSEDTGRFAPYFDLYREMITQQLTYDALKAVDFDVERMNYLEEEREFVRQLGRGGKLIQAIFVARKRGVRERAASPQNTQRSRRS
jgi:sarcosine/dimethylglycine N-methyltransferase